MYIRIEPNGDDVDIRINKWKMDEHEINGFTVEQVIEILGDAINNLQFYQPKE